LEEFATVSMEDFCGIVLSAHSAPIVPILASMNAMKQSLVLAVNAGSSSLKASLINDQGVKVASFQVEQLETASAKLRFQHGDTNDETAIPDCSYEEALGRIMEHLKNHDWISNVVGSGHRVVHGGERFHESVLVTDAILHDIEQVSHLAPLHNPHNVEGIRALQKLLPDKPAVAVFDTSFHSTLPEVARTYPLPKRYRDAGMRKYGFHGTSVRFVVQKATDVLKRWHKSADNLIVCHLGNGASITAVSNGKSVETSMGFSPLAGVMMGSRSGSVDPAIVQFAVHRFDKTLDDVLQDLNNESGLKAMYATDMRTVVEDAPDNPQAQLALDMFVYRVAKHISSSLVALTGPVDAIVFTGGIGEHSTVIRRECVKLLQRSVLPGFELDSDRNRANGAETDGILTVDGATPLCLDIATDEEAMIALDCFGIVNRGSDDGQSEATTRS